jgi:oligoendopeptidase F
MAKDRASIPAKDKWDIFKIYSSIEDFEKDFEKFKLEFEKNKFLEFKDKLINDSKLLKNVLDYYFLNSQILEKMYVFAHLLFDEDLTNNEAKSLFERISSLSNDFESAWSFLEPEIIKSDQDLTDQDLTDLDLLEYKFYLKKVKKLKDFTLSEKEEKLLSMSLKPCSFFYKTFSSFTNSDMKFDSVEDSKGKKHPLTNGTYLVYVRSDDRVLRKNAFISLHNKYKEYENTLNDLIAAQMDAHIFYKRAKNYKSCLDAALFKENIDTDVYYNLIGTTKKNVGSLKDYFLLKRKTLNYEKLHLYDFYVPIVKDLKFEKTVDEAKGMVLESVGVLGDDYQNVLRKGFNEKRWVDFFETPNKRSGAYSSGCFGTDPYILMNYHNNFNDVTTLAHESGHSMHSYLSCQNQKYQYSSYPIFVAEIASTFNELLLIDYLLEHYKDNLEMKAFLLNKHLDGIYATFFRQTLFADFELNIHQKVERCIPLTADLLNDEFVKLYKTYYGYDFVNIDEEVKLEWSRIPHFYYNFYVYQYATGISAAIYLFNEIKNDENNCRIKYLNFLKAGGSDYPLNLLKIAGIDMKKPEIFENTISYFNNLVKKLSLTLKEIKK